MKKEHYILLGGGALLLWLLARGKKIICPLDSVMQWKNIAEQESQDSYNIFGRPVTANILAVIQDQSQGDPNSVYFSGGVWQRYGLCGVPLAWAQEFNLDIKPEQLLDPRFNIDIMLKIIAYVNVKIDKAYQRAGITLSVISSPTGAPYPTANAYSAYYHSNTINITDARDPNIHVTNTIDRYLSLTKCYRQFVDY